ncbi:unnamed protein product [Acanthoscelides obtectus]|uniref:Uncharacterized protein n=1 Tax=Acanthoscelides obtectus TaxID=200917 RepID=A0A9P0Q970_ACAOB|nr:unnamed protein product [Acanthoscelides obtectus]CAK1680773.1 hypothetical protein AOBTE_LOCUS32872 [Acanthoscelides obtectus]
MPKKKVGNKWYGKKRTTVVDPVSRDINDTFQDASQTEHLVESSNVEQSQPGPSTVSKMPKKKIGNKWYSKKRNTVVDPVSQDINDTYQDAPQTEHLVESSNVEQPQPGPSTIASTSDQ